MEYFECINPTESTWSQLWGEVKSSKESQEARQKTIDIMDWAEKHVKLT